jgi:hypothetical protein
MNPFFDTHCDMPFDIPRSVYARFDQCEPMNPAENEETILVFSAVSADWYEQQDTEIFRLDSASPAPRLWAQYWRALFGGTGSELPRIFLDKPFERMPLFHYEISIRADDDIFEFATNENRWMRIESARNGPLEAEVYGNLFGTALNTKVSLHRVENHEAQVLDETFDMKKWPNASKAKLRSALSVREQAVSLAAFDVGQGSASALLDRNQVPWLYHDLGAGVTRNAKTTPVPLEFCWTKDPAIVLSHWDSDHWAGARHDPRALDKTWITPRQSIGPTHTAFANDILQAGGQILIWPTGMAPITIQNASNQSLTIGRCTGNNRNGSCLALRVDDNSQGTKLHWLLTGDAGYHQLPFGLPGDIAAMVVPHHGAKMAGLIKTPPRSRNAYARLLFSFGPGNAHGSTHVRHPTQTSVQAHVNKGWGPGTWLNVTNPGDTIAGTDVLATAKHTSNHRGGVVAGWVSAPTAYPRPCNNAFCTADIKQS